MHERVQGDGGQTKKVAKYADSTLSQYEHTFGLLTDGASPAIRCRSDMFAGDFTATWEAEARRLAERDAAKHDGTPKKSVEQRVLDYDSVLKLARKLMPRSGLEHPRGGDGASARCLGRALEELD